MDPANRRNQPYSGNVIDRAVTLRTDRLCRIEGALSKRESE
jgi:hypothetical protein